MTAVNFDVLIIGSGFSGSLLGWILASQGRRVLLVDAARHPRFAIGESSTPTADFLLAHLADRWQLRPLAPLACWGTWKRRSPELLCGKKRGFSYYRHVPGQPYADDPQHSRSLLVAASLSDEWSDTHWVRSSVDSFLADQATQAGCELLQDTRLEQLERSADGIWQAQLRSAVEGVDPELRRVQCRWCVDASGSGNALARFVGNPPQEAWLRTRSQAVFGHFSGVPGFAEAAAVDDTFCGDEAAQHHVLENGWCWMLRMDHGITSVGLVEPARGWRGRPEEHFRRETSRYPSLRGLLERARLTAPAGGMGSAARLSRCRRSATGPGWVLLPLTYGFIDPLHSSGIAHALSGVLRVATALLANAADMDRLLAAYARDLRQELEWLDVLTAGCYRAQPSFRCFRAFAMFYFLAAIGFEKQLAADPTSWPLGYLQSADQELKATACRALQQLSSGSAPATEYAELQFEEYIRREIARWNTVGLLDPKLNHRIAHTAPPKYAAIASQL
jgi:FADH2 O2-dependent halogenase